MLLSMTWRARHTLRRAARGSAHVPRCARATGARPVGAHERLRPPGFHGLVGLRVAAGRLRAAPPPPYLADQDMGRVKYMFV